MPTEGRVLDARSRAPGTARGNWFVQGTNGYRGLPPQQQGAIDPRQQRGYWDTHLALAYDAVDPSTVIVSVGDFGGCACQFAVGGNATYSQRKRRSRRACALASLGAATTADGRR